VSTIEILRWRVKKLSLTGNFTFFVLLVVVLTNVEISFSEDSIRFSLGATVDLDNKFFVLDLILVDKELRDK
jgi:hypothetical protein